MLLINLILFKFYVFVMDGRLVFGREMLFPESGNKFLGRTSRRDFSSTD